MLNNYNSWLMFLSRLNFDTSWFLRHSLEQTFPASWPSAQCNTHLSAQLPSHLYTMGENNTCTIFKGCGVKYLLTSLTCIEAWNALALKFTTTELMDTYMPSTIRSAKPYFPPELKSKTAKFKVFCTCQCIPKQKVEHNGAHLFDMDMEVNAHFCQFF